MKRQNHSLRVYGALCFAVLAALCGQAVAATLYVLENTQRSNSLVNNATRLATIDTVTGVFTPVQTLLSGTAFVKDLAYNANTGDFYTSGLVGTNSDLRTLTTAGVLSSSIGTIAKDPYAMWYNSSTGTLSIYNRTNNQVGTVNTTTAAFTSTASSSPAVDNIVGGRGATLGGVNYFINAQLSGTGPNSTFGSINLATGVQTATGTSSQYQRMVLASDGVDLYGLVPTTTGTAILYKINPTNGALSSPVSVVASSGTIGPQFSGAAFAVVPEPSTIALAVSGIAMLAAGMRSRRRASARRVEASAS